MDAYHPARLGSAHRAHRLLLFPSLCGALFPVRWMFTREGYYLRLPTPPQGAPQKYAPTHLAPPFATTSLLCPPGHSSMAIRVSTLGKRRCHAPSPQEDAGPSTSYPTQEAPRRVAIRVLRLIWPCIHCTFGARRDSSIRALRLVLTPSSSTVPSLRYTGRSSTTIRVSPPGRRRFVPFASAAPAHAARRASALLARRSHLRDIASLLELSSTPATAPQPDLVSAFRADPAVAALAVAALRRFLPPCTHRRRLTPRAELARRLRASACRDLT